MVYNFKNIQRHPFNWKILYGYIGSIFIQIISQLAGIYVYCIVFSITLGFCLFCADFTCDIQRKLWQLNKYMIYLKKKKLTIKEKDVLKKSWLTMIN